MAVFLEQNLNIQCSFQNPSSNLKKVVTSRDRQTLKDCKQTLTNTLHFKTFLDKDEN